MQSTNLDKVGTLRLYGCGGGGINLVREFDNVEDQDAPGTAKLLPCYIDTSTSNLTEIDQTKTFILPDLDGSGKVRKENHEKIAKAIPQILVKLPPADFNVVVFTASGGTGSVAGPLLLRELLTRGQNVVAVVVGSEESAITSTNTFNTLKSLDHIARSLDVPVVMHYSLNTRKTKRSEIDSQVQIALSALSVLTSRQNRELDSMDVTKWVKFNQSTPMAAQLALLQVHADPIEFVQHASACFSVAYVMHDADDPQPDMIPAYSCAGYYRDDVRFPKNLFLGIETQGLESILTHLTKMTQTLEQHAQARQQGPAFVQDHDEISNTGLIL